MTAPAVRHIAQLGGLVHDIDWEQVTDLTLGTNPTPGVVENREGLRDALIEAHARYLLGDEAYERAAAE